MREIHLPPAIVTETWRLRTPRIPKEKSPAGIDLKTLARGHGTVPKGRHSGSQRNKREKQRNEDRTHEVSGKIPLQATRQQGAHYLIVTLAEFFGENAALLDVQAKPRFTPRGRTNNPGRRVFALGLDHDTDLTLETAPIIAPAGLARAGRKRVSFSPL
jgi:hypothetical protein